MIHLFRALRFTVIYVPTRLLEAVRLRLARSMQDHADRRSDRWR